MPETFERGDRVIVTIPESVWDHAQTIKGEVVTAFNVGHKAPAWHISIRQDDGSIAYWTQPLQGGTIVKEK